MNILYVLDVLFYHRDPFECAFVLWFWGTLWWGVWGKGGVTEEQWVVLKLRTVMGVGMGGFGIRGPTNKNSINSYFTTKNRYNVSVLKCYFQLNHNISCQCKIKLLTLEESRQLRSQTGLYWGGCVFHPTRCFCWRFPCSDQRSSHNQRHCKQI